MKQFIQIEAATGHLYELPASVVAENRAKAMLERHPDEFADMAESLADTVELFDDEYEVSDWAKNNMNPDEYMQFARLVRFTPPAQDLSNAAEWTMHDHRSPTGELDGNQIMSTPVEAVASMMAASNQLCNITVLNSPDGEPHAAMVLVIGDKNVVGAYITALGFVTEKLTNGPQGEQTH